MPNPYFKQRIITYFNQPVQTRCPALLPCTIAFEGEHFLAPFMIQFDACSYDMLEIVFNTIEYPSMKVIRKDETKERNLYSFQVVTQESWISSSPKYYRVNATIRIGGKIYAYNYTDVYLTTFKCNIILQPTTIFYGMKIFCNQSEPCLLKITNRYAYDDPLCTP